MLIEFEFEREEYRIFDEAVLKDWILFVLQKEEKRLGEIVYQFVSDETILKVNQDYLAHDYYTDIITFDDSFVNIINGSIYVSLETVKYNSQILEKNFKSECYRVIIHGIMHLCGYKDSTDEEKLIMRKKEDDYLIYLEKI